MICSEVNRIKVWVIIFLPFTSMCITNNVSYIINKTLILNAHMEDVSTVYTFHDFHLNFTFIPLITKTQ